MNKSNYKIGIYLRVSTREQAEQPEGSLKNQQQRLVEEIERRNKQGYFGELVEIYKDEGLSAKDTKRAAYQRMIRDISAKRINMIMAAELSRISRNLRDFCNLWEELKRQECGLISLRENYDTSTVMGEFMVQHGVLMSQHERMMIKDRVKTGMNDRAKRGLFNGGLTPFGYKLNPEKKGHLAIHEEDSAIVRLAFDTFLTEQALALTAKRLNALGKRIKGREFDVSNTHYLLRNRTYLGLRNYMDRGEKKEVKACWEAIVETNKFDKVQDLLKKSKFKRKSPSRSRFPYILSGLCFCAYCGDRLCGKSAHGNSGKVGYYAHANRERQISCSADEQFTCKGRRRYPAKKLEPVVLEKIKELVKDPVFAKKIWLRAKRISEESPSKREAVRLEKQHKKLSIEEQSLAVRISKLPEDIPADALYKRLKQLGAEKSRLQEHLNVLNVKGEQEHLSDFSEFKLFLDLMDECLNKAGEKVKAKIISQLVHRIDVGEDVIKIWFYVGAETLKGQKKFCSLFLKNFGLNNGSTTLTNGGPGET